MRIKKKNNKMLLYIIDATKDLYFISNSDCNNSKEKSSSIKNILNVIITTTISTIIATVIATFLIDTFNTRNIKSLQKDKLLYDLQSIAIGCNKEWMDSAFGVPVFTNVDKKMKEEVYITNIALIRAFFDLDSNSCKMFFVTQTTEQNIPFMPTINNAYYNTFDQRKKLGNLSYDKIDYGTIIIKEAYGYYTNGSGRTFYGEGYESYSDSDHNIFFASLDYGINTPWIMMDDVFSNNYSKKEKSIIKI